MYEAADMSDEILTSKIKSGSKDEDEAFRILAEKYEGIIAYNLSKVKIPVGVSKWSDEEDLYQECRIVLYKAAKRYDSLKGVKFSTYANVCVRNYLVSFLRKYGGEKAHMSLDDIPQSELAAFDVYDFEGFFGELEGLFEILTSFERQIFMMYIEHNSYKHIAKILNKSVKSVDNAVYRIKNKIKPYADTLRR